MTYDLDLLNLFYFRIRFKISIVCINTAVISLFSKTRLITAISYGQLMLIPEAPKTGNVIVSLFSLVLNI